MSVEGIARLIDGARRWSAGATAERAGKTAAVFIAAPDMAVDPAMLCGAGPGTLYVIRTPAALVPPSAESGADPADMTVSAALEYGVRLGGGRDVVVLGHSACGLIATLAAEAGGEAVELARSNSLRAVAALAAPAVARTLRAGASDADRRRHAAMEVVRLSLENLMTYPWLLDRVLAGEVALHGWCLDADAPALWVLDPEADEFRRA